jgi:hypothetical protein
VSSVDSPSALHLSCGLGREEVANAVFLFLFERKKMRGRFSFSFWTKENEGLPVFCYTDSFMTGGARFWHTD